jgi:hypothetical protein
MARQPNCPWPPTQCGGGCRVCRGEEAPESDGPHRQVSLGAFLMTLMGHVVQMPLAARDERMREEGREEMRRRHGILDAEESRALAEILKNPPAPPPALIEAVRKVTQENDPVRAAWVKALTWASKTCWMCAEDIRYAASVSSLPGAAERCFALDEMAKTLRKKAVSLQEGEVLP